MFFQLAFLFLTIFNIEVAILNFCSSTFSIQFLLFYIFNTVANFANLTLWKTQNWFSHPITFWQETSRKPRDLQSWIAHKHLGSYDIRGNSMMLVKFVSIWSEVTTGRGEGGLRGRGVTCYVRLWIKHLCPEKFEDIFRILHCGLTWWTFINIFITMVTMIINTPPPSLWWSWLSECPSSL